MNEVVVRVAFVSVPKSQRDPLAVKIQAGWFARPSPRDVVQKRDGVRRSATEGVAVSRLKLCKFCWFVSKRPRHH